MEPCTKSWKNLRLARSRIFESTHDFGSAILHPRDHITITITHPYNIDMNIMRWAKETWEVSLVDIV